MARRAAVLPGVVVAVLLAAVGEAHAQVSPGPLAAAHKELDTPLKCFECHGQGKEAMRERCLACHKDIAWTIEHQAGLHAQKGNEKCAACHPDHAGPEFAMIAWEEGSPEKFDHARTGWPLAGKHAALKCAECHMPRFQTAESAKLLKRKDHAKSWLGLERVCASCHAREDVHRGALGKDCARCHDEKAWKPAPRFDHAKTEYPLTGRHADVPCAKCHLAASLRPDKDAEGKPIPRYKPVPHQECSACHADPHAARLGPQCSKCHATTGWTQTGRKGFDHDKTRYPLRGRHAALRCEQCHDPRAAWGKKPPFQSCTACHADARAGHADPHAGKATLQGKAVDCASCHDVKGWTPSTYTVEMHRAAAYPLQGKHAEVRCASCHRRSPAGVAPETLGSSGVLMRMAHARCRDCHGDDHGGQLARRPGAGACESCHKVEGWKPSTFTVADHARLRLALVGRHAAIACAACHGPQRRGLAPLPGNDTIGRAGVALTLREIDCVACHVDPHQGRFSPRGARAKATGCLACHSLQAFRPSTVDVTLHRSFGSPLEGAHRAVPCDDCHRESKGQPIGSSLPLPARELPRLTFEVADKRCQACHADPHGGQFARRKAQGACSGCHNEDFFRPASRFDHAKDAGFSLEGAHAKVPCARCHPAKRDAAGKPFVVYRPVPKDCKACHGEART